MLKILARGDKAIATARARSFSKLADLKTRGAYTYELDVTAQDDDLQDFAKRIIEEHGHVDAVVNNAGGLFAVLGSYSCILTLLVGCKATLRWRRRSLPRQFFISSPMSLVSNRAIFSREEVSAQFKYALDYRSHNSPCCSHTIQYKCFRSVEHQPCFLVLYAKSQNRVDHLYRLLYQLEVSTV